MKARRPGRRLKQGCGNKWEHLYQYRLTGELNPVPKCHFKLGSQEQVGVKEVRGDMTGTMLCGDRDGEKRSVELPKDEAERLVEVRPQRPLRSQDGVGSSLQKQLKHQIGQESGQSPLK